MRSRIFRDDGTQTCREESAVVIRAQKRKAIPVAYVSDSSSGTKTLNIEERLVTRSAAIFSSTSGERQRESLPLEDLFFLNFSRGRPLNVRSPSSILHRLPPKLPLLYLLHVPRRVFPIPLFLPLSPLPVTLSWIIALARYDLGLNSRDKNSPPELSAI